MKNSLVVKEIFRSIQGESSYQGLPCAFVRLSGCNLDCSYCDTSYARSGGEKIDCGRIAEKVVDMGAQLVEITGGEPLLQDGAYTLMQQLLSRNLTVLLETNGSIDISRVPAEVIKIVDMKCPGSGMESHMRFENIGLLLSNDELKFVMSGRSDYEWGRKIVEDYGILKRCRVLFAPAYGSLSPADLASWILEDNLFVRLNLQLHKYVWGPDTRK